MENTIVNLEIIHEEMHRCGQTAEFVPAQTMPGLRELRFYLPGCDESGDKRVLYACVRGHCPGVPKSGALLLFGEWEREELPERGGYILCHDLNPFEVVNLVESVFSRFAALQNALLNALNEQDSLRRICELSREHFGSHVFIHDEHFCLLASSMNPADLSRRFDYNPLLDCYMQDERTLMNFRTSEAYQKTYETRGGQLWVSDYDDSCCAYVNLMLDGVYRGRMNILSSRVTPGQLRTAEYVGSLAARALYQAFVTDALYRTPAMQIIADAVDGAEIGEERVLRLAQLMNWNADDRYLCAMIALGNGSGDNQYMIMGICNSILRHVRGSYPCYYKNAVYVLVNLSVGELNRNDLRMQMSYLIRDSMLRAGVSNEFHDLSELSVYLRQAEITLLYAQEKRLMSWYNEFRDTALPYWLQKGIGNLSGESIIAGELNTLKAYDAENGSDLYETLKVYLINERNSTLTGQLLRVHRSTLPHRLERIRALTGLDLDDFRTRLYLLMSFALEDGSIIRGSNGQDENG